MSKAGKILSYVIHCIYVMVLPMFILRSGYFQADVRFKYLPIFSLFLLGLFLIDRVMPIKKNKILIVLPILFLTVFGLYVNSDGLVPFVFPVITILFFLAFAILIILPKNRMIMILVSSFIILFYSFGIYPKLIVRKEIVETSLSLNSITLHPFVSVQKDSVNIHLERPVLIDFMFTSCGPCLKKLTYLQAIKNLDLSIYVIVDGKIDSYTAFQDYYTIHNQALQGINFLYDPDGRFTEQFNIDSYPTEILIRNRELIAMDKGIPDGALKEYAELRKQLMMD
ncbi:MULTISPECIES: TlpA family protein disulfide reductase [Sphingobacterium]|jgi:thiol-disulfide isomerase/thioredoxin|uniref:TlpA family protein disulfide reductase n=1 Tax=Sphingobacterium TaxID=28453 RepID=UPI00257DA90A|nr:MULTISPECIES: hypothetical protein [Sphingobacterium]